MRDCNNIQPVSGLGIVRRTQNAPDYKSLNRNVNTLYLTYRTSNLWYRNSDKIAACTPTLFTKKKKKTPLYTIIRTSSFSLLIRLRTSSFFVLLSCVCGHNFTLTSPPYYYSKRAAFIFRSSSFHTKNLMTHRSLPP